MILYQYWLYVARSQHLWCRYGLNLGANWLAPKLFSFVFPFLFALFSSFFSYIFLMFFFFNLWLFILSSFFSSFHPIFIDHCRFLCLPMDISLYTIISLSFSHPFSILLFFFSSFIMCPSSPYVGLLTSGLIPSKIALSNPLSPSNES